MVFFYKTLLAAVLLTGYLTSLAQTSVNDKFVPDIRRQLFHDNIDKAQKATLAADGRADDVFYFSRDENINQLVTIAITETVDSLQYIIETDSSLTHNIKVGYLRGVENILRKFSAGYRNRSIQPSCLPVVFETYRKAMEADKNKQSIAPLIVDASYEVGTLIVESGAFDANTGLKAAKYELIRKDAGMHPEKIFLKLKSNPDVPFRDSLIKVAAYKYPKLLYDYAAAQNDLGYAIRRIDDPMIKTVSQLAQSRGGQIYLAFLDDILSGKQTIASIDAVKDDDLKYYRLLVNTRLNYIKRIQNGEHVWEMNSLTEMLRKKVSEVYIKTINGLHEEQDAVRFRVLQPLTAQELYYLAVFGENEIYTSSYTAGVYPLMMKKIGNRGDSLMASVAFDKFKKFIKMAAGFNTLNEFLKSFPKPEYAKSLMTAFVNGLEKSEGLEDGVDVADSYISIFEGNKQLAKDMLALTKWNYDKNVGKNKRGETMYNLLYKLFLSADTTQKIKVNLSQEFGIPPVYSVDYSTLADTAKRVIVQVFFYGDKDGKGIFQSFLGLFPSSNWKITPAEKWVTISSIKGKPVWIFANRALDEETGEDEQAQKALDEYLEEKGLQPSIVIHRGHSYYASSTIKQIQSSAKIVYLGSCGGYHLIHDVLNRAPEAHIIASKQIGMGAINKEFIKLLSEKLRTGQTIEWMPFWREFKNMVGNNSGFDDYIPPYKNLGALFIKAYRQAMGDDDDEVE